MKYMHTARARTKKFTASVDERILEMIDARAQKLESTRSDIVEQAMKLWLKKQIEQEEEQYFSAAAEEMNTDAELWNALTSQSLTKNID
jgi:metal-responsive CopG/Arc/MetJ family transcriptional regulator